MPERAADDFTTIREHLERIKKEQEEALKTGVDTSQKSDEEVHKEVYGEYCNGNNTVHTLAEQEYAAHAKTVLKTAVATANAAVGVYEADSGRYYYDELLLDEEDEALSNITYEKAMKFIYNNSNVLPRIIP